MTRTLADRIDAVLPQTQCTKCGYDACRPYAEAIAQGAAAHNRCVPGGRAGVERLSALLDREPLALDPECGVEAPRRVAVIDPGACIGCTKCIAACPVDAIIGAPRRMHTVIGDRCTGCDLCLPPCPVDCIEMREAANARAWSSDDAMRARARHDARRARLEGSLRVQMRAAAQDSTATAATAANARKRLVLEAAARRARELRDRAGQGR
ncbi:MAG: RnfABCDGE type electron transport complex subunit B [Burkholderiaceae bacterium]|nr:RnfABCDGE type electron transport complex subunit B [Burkholderiaceae bacterium]